MQEANKSNMYTVALFSDVHMLPGLHVTLLSMLRSLDADKAPDVDIQLFLDHVPKREQQRLQETHQRCNKGSRLHIVDYSPQTPSGGDLLHGSATTYGRLSLPLLLPDASHCVYLDSDLIVNRSITEIFQHFDGEHTLLVGGVGHRKHSVDTALFTRAGLDLNGPYFNAGVLGIVLLLWRERDADRLVQTIAKKYRGMFKSADQALLNTAFHASFKAIGIEYNTAMYPAGPVCSESFEKILHFVGSPKPWDFLGSISSNHYEMWKSIYRETAIANIWPIKYSSLSRTVRVARQSYKAIKKKMSEKDV